MYTLNIENVFGLHMSEDVQDIQKTNPILGCIADDFTGASDMASFLRKGGLNTIQINGVPDDDFALRKYSGMQVDAIVIALKTRTCEPSIAISESLQSLSWLQRARCSRFYFKYCSTFDSTERGNIGPVIDALMDKLAAKHTIVCPALPVNGRTVYMGQLFVHGTLLHQSPMATHPLNPMNDSDLASLLDAQVADINKKACGHIGYPDLSKLETYVPQQNDRYIVTDALETGHLQSIAKYFACHPNFPLLTGGSGLAEFLGEAYREAGWLGKTPSPLAETRLSSPTLVIAGSCSQATQGQVEHSKSKLPSLYINPNDLASGRQNAQSIAEWIQQHAAQSVLLYSTESAAKVSANQDKLGLENAASIIEKTLADAAAFATNAGYYKNIVVAGGETSGAVVSALGIKHFVIGQSVAPGVPLMRAETSSGALQLALKSGNFGDYDFFSTTIETMTL